MSPHSPFARGGVATFAPQVPVTHALSQTSRAHLFLQLATEPHTQWSARKAAILELHKLACSVIVERKRLARLTPGPGFSDRAVRAFVAKLKRVAWYSNSDTEVCGDLLDSLDQCLAVYLEAFEQAYAETSANELSDAAADRWTNHGRELRARRAA
jgi:hypothetical protein